MDEFLRSTEKKELNSVKEWEVGEGVASVREVGEGVASVWEVGEGVASGWEIREGVGDG